MANNKRKNRKRSSVKRKDYTQGGRVKYAEGDSVEQDRINAIRNNRAANRSRGRSEAQEAANITAPSPAPVAPTPSTAPVSTTTPTSTNTTQVQNQQVGEAETIAQPTPSPTPSPYDIGFGNVQPGEYSDEQKPDATGAMKRTTPISMEDPAKKSAFDIAREYRILRTGKRTEEASTGVVPEAGIIKPAVQVGIDPETGKPIPEQKVTTMAEPTKVTAGQADQVAPEQVAQVTDVSQVDAPTSIEAAQMEAATVGTDAQVDVATGTVSDEALAQAAGVDRVAPIDAAQIEIIPGALTERVVGTISADSLAPIVENVGSSLAKVTRAKKQLANAGLNEADIEELGNDPEALEARLMEFSEAERGIIEGLPEEALVSNQLNSLLNGIEEGEIPTWARPAVASVEAMLAQRGMEASTVGRDALLNTIIQSAMPIAQSNAQAIQASIGQQKTIEAQEAEANAARAQQTALSNASTVFQMDMAQFSADQQTALSNSKFLQTVGITEANMRQQTTIQDAILMSQANLAEADFFQKTQIQNAQSFLQMDLTNLSNEQQANVLTAQQTQQRLLSNQSATNASRQFNAASENQTQQFMANLEAQAQQFNSSQVNAMSQFNTSQTNAAEARRAAREADLNKFNAQLVTQVDQFNSQQDFARNQWNAQNASAVEASNVQWRRQANTANTAAQNQINMQNAMNAFNLSSQSLSFMWQELRDQADFDFRAAENEQNRNAQILSTAIANEGKSGEKYDDYLLTLVNTLGNSYRGGLFGG